MKKPQSQKRVRIPLAVGEEARVRDRAVEALVEHGEIYQRAHMLVTVIPNDEERSGYSIYPLPPAGLRGTLSESCEFTVTKTIKCLPVEVLANVPDPLVRMIHAMGHWPGIRYLDRIIGAPTIRGDGSILQTPGYDDATGCLYLPSGNFSRIPDQPSKADACSAFKEIEEVFCDFPFVDASARAVVIAAILTLVGRSAIAGDVPMFAFDANTRGSGKTKLTNVVSIIAFGKLIAKTTFPSRDEELDKTLSSFALSGSDCVCFDNIDREIGGGALDKCITSGGRVSFRILGRSETVELPWHATILATGNNLRFLGDTIRRVLLARLESSDERPEERSNFRHTDLERWVSENRPRLVSAALTILRAWFAAGRPGSTEGTWGSFTAWTSIIPPAITFAGGANPMAHRGELEEAAHDSEREAAQIVLIYLPKFGHAGTTVQDLLRAVYPNGAAPKNDAPPDGYNDLRDALEMLCGSIGSRPPNSNEVARAFKKLRDRWFADRKLVSRKGRSNRKVWLAETREGGGEAGEAQSLAASIEI